MYKLYLKKLFLNHKFANRESLLTKIRLNICFIFKGYIMLVFEALLKDYVLFLTAKRVKKQTRFTVLVSKNCTNILIKLLSTFEKFYDPKNETFLVGYFFLIQEKNYILDNNISYSIQIAITLFIT